MDFKNILVPVAGREADDETIVLACRLARLVKSKICAARQRVWGFCRAELHSRPGAISLVDAGRTFRRNVD